MQRLAVLRIMQALTGPIPTYGFGRHRAEKAAHASEG